MRLWVGDWLCMCAEEQNLAVLMLNFMVSWVEQKGGGCKPSCYQKTIGDRGGLGIERPSDLLWFPWRLCVPDL